MRKFSLEAVQYDITLANGNVIATVTRTAADKWIFRDLERKWTEESFKKLKAEDLLAEYLAIRARHNTARIARARIKAAAVPRDQSQKHRPAQ